MPQKEKTQLNPTINAAEWDQTIVRVYKSFYAQNKRLFKENPQQYQSELRRYVEERAHEIKYRIRAI